MLNSVCSCQYRGTITRVVKTSRAISPPADASPGGSNNIKIFFCTRCALSEFCKMEIYSLFHNDFQYFITVKP